MSEILAYMGLPLDIIRIIAIYTDRMGLTNMLRLYADHPKLIEEVYDHNSMLWASRYIAETGRTPINPVGGDGDLFSYKSQFDAVSPPHGHLILPNPILDATLGHYIPLGTDLVVRGAVDINTKTIITSTHKRVDVVDMIVLHETGKIMRVTTYATIRNCTYGVIPPMRNIYPLRIPDMRIMVSNGHYMVLLDVVGGMWMASPLAISNSLFDTQRSIFPIEVGKPIKHIRRILSLAELHLARGGNVHYSNTNVHALAIDHEGSEYIIDVGYVKMARGDDMNDRCLLAAVYTIPREATTLAHSTSLEDRPKYNLSMRSPIEISDTMVHACDRTHYGTIRMDDDIRLVGPGEIYDTDRPAPQGVLTNNATTYPVIAAWTHHQCTTWSSTIIPIQVAPRPINASADITSVISLGITGLVLKTEGSVVMVMNHKRADPHKMADILPPMQVVALTSYGAIYGISV